MVEVKNSDVLVIKTTNVNFCQTIDVGLFIEKLIM